MINRLFLAAILAGLVGMFSACGGTDGYNIPLHGLEQVQSDLDLAPSGLRVLRISGPTSLQVGSTWELKALASDPEGSDVTFHWKATSGKLSRSEGQRTFFTATEPVGRAEIEIEAVDPAGNLVRGAFGVAVPYDLPSGAVMDIRDSVGYHCSLEIDTNDNPHIAFHNTTHPSLHYAFHDGNQWEIETIEGYGLDIGGAAGQNASLALDSSGNVHIAYLTQYTDQTDISLNYATKSGATWDLVTVDSSDTRGHFNVTLKINPATNMPEILYNSSSTASAKHAVCSGNCLSSSSWSKVTVYTETRGPSNNRAYAGGFAIETDGTRHATISGRYENSSWNDFGDLIYAVRSGASWSTSETIIPEESGAYYYDSDTSRLALDRDDRPLVLHFDGVYHRLSSNNWSLSEVESSGLDQTSSYARFDIDCDQSRTPPSSGVVWLASPHGGALELVKTNSRGYFEYTYIGSITTTAMARASIAVDSAGDGHICWVDGGVLMFQ
ncbi:MAG: hypothetical protein JRJ19_00640 [Deltaproteobacteria bacterium]|nr:hypothetical protein [Deltaproteobacteria bacterium]MBW1870537.1 hypothetical protein [Deltaproteobacteria bacterium]